MKLTKVVFYFNRKKTASRTKCASVELQVTAGSRRIYRSTGVKLLIHQWNDRLLVVNHPDQTHLNIMLDGLLRQTKEWCEQQLRTGRPVTEDSFSAFWRGNNQYDYFCPWLQSVITSRRDLRDTTRRQHMQMAETVMKFGGLKFFSDLTPETIRAFDSWLHTSAQREVTTIFGYHKRLKTYINIAIREQVWFGPNPYTLVKIPRGRSKARAYLQESEMKQLAAHDFRQPTLNNVRDLYLFQCLTGLSYAELTKFDYDKEVKITDDGCYILTDRRQKTGTDYMVVLLPSALAILRAHDNRLPVMSNAKYNLYLKIIDAIMGWNKGLTTHSGRHTFAMTALNRGIPIEVVARILGHTDIHTTQIYAKIVQETVVSAFGKLDGVI